MDGLEKNTEQVMCKTLLHSPVILVPFPQQIKHSPF